MAKLILNAGTTNNDKTGDTLRAGALKIRANFEEIYTALANNGSNISGGNVLKTGSYNDLNNKPSFSTVAVSGNFYDLSARPDLGILVGEPPNETGTDGNVFGNMAYADGSFYFCFEDYVQQLSFTDLNALNDNSYHLNIPWLAGYQALLDAFQNSMTLSVNPGTDGNWRNITAISKNTGTNKLDITYEGSNFAATTGITVKINQPQIWKSIPWSPDYSNPFPGISTGDWTWPEGGGGTQALLGGESGSYIDGQSPGGLLIHNDNIVTLQAGDKGLSYNDTGILQFQEGSTITETATTLILTPPTALTGQSLVIRTTVGGGLFTTDTFTPGEAVTVTLIDNGSHLSTGGYVDDSESNTWAYTITGISEADLGSPLTGSFLAENWGVPSISQNEITFNIPAESGGTGFTITLDKVITEPPYYLSGISLNEDNRISLTVGTVVNPEISHVHLTTADPSTVDLYLGDDDQYVKIEKDGGDVVIGTNANTKRWRFDNNGELTLPAGGNVVLSTGAPAFVYISVLKQLVSDSTDFADFQSRIAAL